jgi:hypothetical protein
MAKVKITGHASGTGVITVTAPNTSTDRTITLPDGDVTLGAATPSITDGGNATAITIDSNENVGIGVTPESTQSQYYKTLDVASGASVYGHTTVTNRAYFGANQYLHSSGVQKYKATSTASLHEMDSGTHKFKVAPSGSADADITWINAMTIDNTGAVTKPLQPAFHAYMGTTLANISPGIVDLPFDTEIFDNNSDFNTSTYKFTAPVTGKYQFNITQRADNIDYLAAYYRINLTTSNRHYEPDIIDPNFTADLNYYSFNLAILTDMDAGDSAYVKFQQNGGSAKTDVMSSTNSIFSGYLVC